jgi:hypothetical protein
MEPAAHALGQAGWTVPYWGPLFLAEDLFQVAEPNQFDSLFEEEYGAHKKKLEGEMFDRLLTAESLYRWRALLLEIKAAYRKKHYRIAIPALLSVFEGSLFFALNRPASKKQVQSLLTRKLATITGSYDRVLWASLTGFAGVVFAPHHFEKIPPERLNRHWVMHGRADPNGQRVACLRLLQALDTLATVDSLTRWKAGYEKL